MSGTLEGCHKQVTCFHAYPSSGFHLPSKTISLSFSWLTKMPNKRRRRRAVVVIKSERPPIDSTTTIKADIDIEIKQEETSKLNACSTTLKKEDTRAAVVMHHGKPPKRDEGSSEIKPEIAMKSEAALYRILGKRKLQKEHVLSFFQVLVKQPHVCIPI